jgi:hypothetical protein
MAIGRKTGGNGFSYAIFLAGFGRDFNSSFAPGFSLDKQYRKI